MIALALALTATQPDFSATPDTALVTYEHGARMAIDWIQHRGRFVRSLSVLTRSATREVVARLADDGSVVHTSTRLANAGSPPGAPIERDPGAGRTYWSDQVASSIEQAIQHALALGGRASFQGASLVRDGFSPIVVERVDSTGWTLSMRDRRYDVLADEDGRVRSVTIPEFGIVVEREVGLTPDREPAWPAYAAPPDRAYRADSVRISCPGGHTLAGTLTRPPGAGPFPAVVFITGISPHERNQGNPPWMPFRDIADALARRGIAGLRVDDRGVAASTGDRASSTTEDEADDVRSEIAWLRARRDIAGRRIALIGLSEGGLIAPMVAAGDSTLAGIVTLAGPGVPGWEVYRSQVESAVAADTSFKTDAARAAEVTRQLADTLDARSKSYLAIDPLAFARRVRCPALILHGGSDRHVPVRSAERIAWAMRANGNRDVTVRIFPGVSHTFLPDPVGLASGWGTLPGVVVPAEILETITDWTATRLAAARRPGVTASAAPRP